jgi:predicted ATPase
LRTYAGSAGGAEWHKWDLHVHTPASVEQHYGDSRQEATWDSYINALAALPPEIRAIGISDYFTLDGYRRVLAASDAGRLPNLQLILPVIELRLTSFVGHSDLSKLNLHVVFSDEMPPDEIEQFFLRRLAIEVRLDGSEPWRGCIGIREGLIGLGEAVRAATPTEKRTTESALRIGFRSAAVEPRAIYDLLNQSVFREKHLTALGLAEWTQMRWDGAGSVQKRDAIEHVDFVLTASRSPAQYKERRAQLIKHGVNDRLFDASDAHYFASSEEPNRLGQTLCWVKSDVTFRGLWRAIVRFDERVFVGEMPSKLEHMSRTRTKYIDTIEIRRNPGSALTETWFDAALQLNPDLVAIIGNQGNGKSALTDVLALCGNSKVEGFSFLNADKFCDKQKKAGEFTATLTWLSGERVTRALDERVGDAEVERVRYVPQGFFEKVTNETEVTEGGRFYSEIRKTLFSHIAPDDRLGCSSLDDLVTLHTKSASAGLSQLRQQLSEINRRIASLEVACGLAEVKRLVAKIEQKEREIATLQASPPAAVAPPPEPSETNDHIERLRAEEREITAEISRTESTMARLKRQRTTLQNAALTLANEERQVRGRVQELQRELADTGLTIDLTRALMVTHDPKVVEAVLSALGTAIEGAAVKLNPAVEQSLTAQLGRLRSERAGLERQLEEASAVYQAYRARLAEWEEKLFVLTGADESVVPDSLRGLRGQLVELQVQKPAELQGLERERAEKCREIHAGLASLARVHEDLTKPVQQHIAREQLTRDRYRLTFDVVLSERGLADGLFSLVSQSGGSFAGVQAGRDRLRQLVSEADLSTAEGALAFAEHVLDLLRPQAKGVPQTRGDLAALMKKGASVEDVYDLLFSLEYVNPTFALALNRKPLRQLSPGERGILLLVFYLVVDRGDEPLVIDQPEGNLNNQSIVEHLVPVFLAAKGRRQVIIVTHNPNLAVVCDAEQIIHCNMEVAGGHRLQYDSGAVENPKFNRLSMELLEGTAIAFEARRATYITDQRDRGGVVQLPVLPWDGQQVPPSIPG